MISLCKDLAKSSKIPMPFYFLKNVFKDMAEGWVQIQVSNATVFQKPHAVLKILKFSAAGHLTYLVSV